MRTDGSYLSASDDRVHIGLGTSDRVSAVSVEWPDGLHESFAASRADRLDVAEARRRAAAADGDEMMTGRRSVSRCTAVRCGASGTLREVQDADWAAARAAEAAAAMQSGRFDAAATIYAELVAARPNDAGLLMNLGMARYMSGHPDQALPVLQKAVRLNASLAPASLFLGASLLDLGQFADATAPLQRAVTLMPKNPDAREMLARSYLGSSRPSRPRPSIGR